MANEKRSSVSAVSNNNDSSFSGGGIAWAGSLVGSQNPNNQLGYRYSTPSKRFRRAADGMNGVDGQGGDPELPTNVVVQFVNREGEEVANQLDLPTNSTVDDLNALLHTLLNPEEEDDEKNNDNKRIPYTFYANISGSSKTKKAPKVSDVEVTTSIEGLLRDYSDKISTEQVLYLTYQPLAVFRVRPVTRCTDTMPGHTDAVLHVSYSPNGQHLASGGGDTTVRFWDVHTSLPKHVCAEHKNHVLCTSWAPDGTRFASSDKNGVLVVWDPVTGKCTFNSTKIINRHKQWITSISWEPLHAISTAKGNYTCERLITSSKDGTAKIWNIRTQKCLVTLSGHTDSIECVKWGGEGFIYTCSRDRTIKVWSVQNEATSDGRNNLGKLVRTLKGHGHRINTLALSTDYVCRTGPFDHKGKTYTTNTIKTNNDYNKDYFAYQAAVEKYKEFKQQTMTTQQQQKRAQDDNENERDGSVCVERLVSGSDDYTICIWNPIQSKVPLKRLTGHQQLINHILYSPDGRYFASGSFDKKIKLWNGYSGEYLSTYTGHVGAIYQIGWSSDSRYIVSASKDSTVKLWEVQTQAKNKKRGGTAKETLPGHEDEVYALDWSPNGSSVATGSKDRTIKIWKH